MKCLFLRVCLYLAVLPALAHAAANSEPSKTSSAIADIEPSSFLINFKDLLLVDQYQKPFAVEDLIGKTVLFNFIFTRCGSVCPTQTRGLVSLHQQLPQEVREQIHFVSITVDPEHDTPKALNDFAQQTHANVTGWSFVTGQPEHIEILLKRLKIFDQSGSSAGVEAHRSSLWLMDKYGRMLQRYKGEPVDKQRLVSELTQISKLKLNE